MKLANFELIRNSQGFLYLVEHTSQQIWLIRKADQAHALIYLNRIPLAVAIVVVIWIYVWPSYVAIVLGVLLYGILSYLFYRPYLSSLDRLNAKERSVVLAGLPNDLRSKQTRRFVGVLYTMLGFLLIVYAHIALVTSTNLVIAYGVAVIAIMRGLRDLSAMR